MVMVHVHHVMSFLVIKYGISWEACDFVLLGLIKYGISWETCDFVLLGLIKYGITWVDM